VATARKEYECFLISAFGTKPLIQDHSRTANFDVLLGEIKSAVQAYEETHPNVSLNIRRADDFSGGIITRQFYQQLHKADIVIAEVSSLNLNVYYELGVRMALRRNVTIMLALKGTPLPFDLHEVRVIFYEPGRLARDRLSELHRLMEDRLAGEEDSPIYAAIPDLEIMRKEGIDELREQIRTLQGIRKRETYGLKILSPAEGSEVGEWFDVSGTYSSLPPKNAARLLNKSPHALGYWPQSVVRLDTQTRTWTGRFHLGGKPPEVGRIVVAVVGKAGASLWEYYQKVGNETGRWPTIQNLTDDVQECDEVRVTKPLRPGLRRHGS